MEKIFYATLNGQLAFAGLNQEQLDTIVNTTKFSVKYAGKWGGISRGNAPVLVVHEDEPVKYRFDSAADENGEQHHTIITTLTGDILLDERKGDWTNRTPDAFFIAPEIRGRVEVLGL